MRQIYLVGFTGSFPKRSSFSFFPLQSTWEQCQPFYAHSTKPLAGMVSPNYFLYFFPRALITENEKKDKHGSSPKTEQQFKREIWTYRNESDREIVFFFFFCWGCSESNIAFKIYKFGTKQSLKWRLCM